MILSGLEHPIVQAPLAGGPSTPELAAAVSEAGGLGFVAAGYRSADEMVADVAAVRERTRAPFGVNLFVPSHATPDPAAVGAYVESLSGEVEIYQAKPGEPRADDDAWDAKLRALHKDPVPVVSFTFGCPARAVVDSLHGAGSEVWVTATDPAEARIARDAGADVLVLQGIEAGGHRASFEDRPDAEGLGVLALLRLVAREMDLPLVATGGIADGPGVAAALVAGAAAAQLGTAFMLAPEADTHPAQREAFASRHSTALTRAFTGRQARGLVNRFMAEHSAGAPIAYPHIHYATAPLRAAARERGDADGFNLWAGQGHRLAVARPAAETVETLAADAREALERVAERART
jgi:nitronate monooxygenase